MTKLLCQTCEVWFEAESSPALPFCSLRCKQIDLARWLDEKCGLPWQSPEDDDAQQAES